MPDKDALKCYHTLNLEPGASVQQIRQSYIELVRFWSPDQFQSNPVLYDEAQKKLREIQDAYKTLESFLIDLERLGAPKIERTPKPPPGKAIRKKVPFGWQAKIFLVLVMMLFAIAYFLYRFGIQETRTAPVFNPNVEEPSH